MKKSLKILSIILCFAVVFSITACTGKNNSEKAAEVSVACLKGPTGVGMAQLMKADSESKTKNDYTFTVTSSADEISGKIVSGEINIASVPTNLAAKLYNKTQGKIVMLAVNTLGVLSIIENGNSIKSVSDLKGKTIYTTGEGSNPEYILKYVLSQNGLTPDKDVTIKYLATNDELIASLVSGTAQVAMVPEPAATTVITKKNTLNKVLSISDEWEKVSDGNLIMGCVVALKSYVAENPQAVSEFLAEYKNSIEFAKNNADSAAQMCEEFEIIPSAAIAKKSIHDCNLTFASGAEIKDSIIGYFNVLFNADKLSIGGTLPADDFYYEEK